MEVLMKIKLRNADGEEKTYNSLSFLGAKYHRKALELIMETHHEAPFPDELDNLVDFIVEVYGNQFTADEFYEGFPSDQLNDKISETLYEVRGISYSEVKKAMEKAKEVAEKEAEGKN